MRKVVLVGPPGVGKTSLLKALEKAGLTGEDLDLILERELGQTPGAYIRERGEENFRDEEHRALLKALDSDIDVLALGGGTFTFERNRLEIRRKAKTLYLKHNAEELARRIYEDEKSGFKERKGFKRPIVYRELSTDGEHRLPTLEQTREGVNRLLQEREMHYEKADQVLHVGGLDEPKIVGEILKLFARRNEECQ